MAKRKPDSHPVPPSSTLLETSKRSRPDPTDALESFVPTHSTPRSKNGRVASAAAATSSGCKISVSNLPKATHQGPRSHSTPALSHSTETILKNLLDTLPQVDEETTSYFATLLKASSRGLRPEALEKEELAPSLNEEEDTFLQELDRALEPPKLPNGGKITALEEEELDEDQQNDVMSKSGSGSGDNGPVEMFDNMSPVKDVTKHHKKSSGKQKGGKTPKVLLKDFDNQDLALLAKRCARMGTCIINMFPDNKLFAWGLFSSTLKVMASEGSADDMVMYLKQISPDRNKRKDLVTFMSYGPSSIRFDIGKEVRIRVTQHFGIPGNLTQEQISSAVTWLMHKRRYHEGVVDIQERTTNGLPFQTKLIGGILRGYFIEGKPAQDEILIEYLKSERQIPLPLIAMVVTLIGNAIQEYAIGYKQVTVLSAVNLGFHYTAIVKTLQDLKLKTPVYYDFLQTKLWTEMNTATPEIVPPQVYDYDALTAFALAAANGEVLEPEVKDKGKGKVQEEIEAVEVESEEEDIGNRKRKTLSESLRGEPTLILDSSPDLENV